MNTFTLNDGTAVLAKEDGSPYTYSNRVQGNARVAKILSEYPSAYLYDAEKPYYVVLGPRAEVAIETPSLTESPSAEKKETTGPQSVSTGNPDGLTWVESEPGVWDASTGNATVTLNASGKKYVAVVRGETLKSDTGSIRFFGTPLAAMGAAEDALTIPVTDQPKKHRGLALVAAEKPLSEGAEAAVASFLKDKKKPASTAGKAARSKKEKPAVKVARKKVSRGRTLEQRYEDSLGSENPFSLELGRRPDNIIYPPVDGTVELPEGTLKLTGARGWWIVIPKGSGPIQKNNGKGPRTFMYQERAIEALQAAAA